MLKLTEWCIDNAKSHQQTPQSTIFIVKKLLVTEIKEMIKFKQINNTLCKLLERFDAYTYGSGQR